MFNIVYTPATGAELIEAAAKWEALAVEQEERLIWDREAGPPCHYRALSYRLTAEQLRARAASAA